MEYKIEASGKVKAFIVAIIPSMLKQLGLTKSRKTLLVRVANECGKNSGSTVNLDVIDSYVVIIKPTRNLKDIGLTLAHELVHVKQMSRGILKPQTNGTNIWAGKRYNKKTKYLDQPWELDAFAKQEIILRRALAE